MDRTITSFCGSNCLIYFNEISGQWLDIQCNWNIYVRIYIYIYMYIYIYILVCVWKFYFRSYKEHTKWHVSHYFAIINWFRFAVCLQGVLWFIHQSSLGLFHWYRDNCMLAPLPTNHELSWKIYAKSNSTNPLKHIARSYIYELRC